ncbi:MAG: alpha/beta fold hydrolase, partial [Myxococcota bacterium]
MTFDIAPRLPRFLARSLPFHRRLFVPDSGADSGQGMHLIDEGRIGAPVIWLQHGNPTWSYLWRNVIGELDTDRFRVVAPDLFGLGLSSKHLSVEAHQVDRHLDSLDALFRALDIDDVFVVGQDWGGPMVAGLGARFPDRVRGLMLMNTSILVPKRPLGTAFHRFAHLPGVSDLVFRGLGFPQNSLRGVQGDRSSIDRRVARAYRWPLRRIRDRSAPLGLARMVPNSGSHPSVNALAPGEQWARGFSGPIELLWGMRDPLLARALRRHERALPDAEVTR